MAKTRCPNKMYTYITMAQLTREWYCSVPYRLVSKNGPLTGCVQMETLRITPFHSRKRNKKQSDTKSGTIHKYSVPFPYLSSVKKVQKTEPQEFCHNSMHRCCCLYGKNGKSRRKIAERNDCIAVRTATKTDKQSLRSPVNSLILLSGNGAKIERNDCVPVRTWPKLHELILRNSYWYPNRDTRDSFVTPIHLPRSSLTSFGIKATSSCTSRHGCRDPIRIKSPSPEKNLYSQ